MERNYVTVTLYFRCITHFIVHTAEKNHFSILSQLLISRWHITACIICDPSVSHVTSVATAAVERHRYRIFIGFFDVIVVTADWVMVAEDAVGRQDNVSVAMVGDEAPYSELELFFFWYRQFHAQLDATLWKIQEGGRPPFWKCINFHFFIVCKRSTDHDDICTTTSNTTQNQIINDSFIFWKIQDVRRSPYWKR